MEKVLKNNLPITDKPKFLIINLMVKIEPSEMRENEDSINSHIS